MTPGVAENFHWLVEALLVLVARPDGELSFVDAANLLAALRPSHDELSAAMVKIYAGTILEAAFPDYDPATGRFTQYTLKTARALNTVTITGMIAL